MDDPSPSSSSVMAAPGAKRKRSRLTDLLPDLERRLPTVKGDAVAAAALADGVRRRIIVRGKQSRAGGLENGNDEEEDEEEEEEEEDTNANEKEKMDAHKAAVQLWNLVLRLDQELAPPAAAAPADYGRLLLCCRVLAFVIIHQSTYPRGMPAAGGGSGGGELSARSSLMYLLDIAVRAARSCIDGHDGELGRAVLDKAAVYRQRLRKLFSSHAADEDTGRQISKFTKLDHSCVIFETTQLWRDNKPQEADKLCTESKASSGFEGTIDSGTAEDLARAFFEIGDDLLAKKDFAAAIPWLDRALSVVPPEDDLAPAVLGSRDERKELRISTARSLVIAALGVQTAEGHARAAELTRSLQAALGENDRRVQLLQLELFASPLSKVFDASGYASVLRGMIATFASSAAEFQLLHHHIQKLHSKSPSLGCQVLDEFLLALRQNGNAIEWVERLVVTRVWLLVQQRETEDELTAAETILSKLRIPISADTAAAAQALIWKRIEQGYQERQYATAIRWCRLALCHIFEASGCANRPLIERKLLLCSMESGDLEAAKAVYASMPDTTRDEPMTQYLLYKLSILINDVGMAVECLRIMGLSAERKELLYACVLHARHAKAPRFMVQAMKKLANTMNNKDPDQVHAPALFRCTILLLRDMIDGNSTDVDMADDGMPEKVESAMRDLADVFGGAVDAMEADRDNHPTAEDRLFKVDELEWFCKAAYNLGLKYAGRGNLRHTVRILEACVRITNMFPVGKDTPSKRMTCHFLVASALAALARRPPPANADEQAIHKDYHAMREHIRAFQAELKQLGKPGEKDSHPDLREKLSVLLVFDFEGAIRLGDWDDLSSIYEMAAACHHADTLRVLGDSLLRSQAQVPSQKFVATMRLTVDKLQEAASLSSDKLIKYYRCLFHATLYRDNSAAFQVLEEVGGLLQTGLDSGVDWPEEELQFLAAVAFNEGMDWFAGGQEDMARQWVRAAARLASQCRDGGKLQSLICTRFRLLNIGDLEVQPSVETDMEMASDDE